MEWVSGRTAIPAGTIEVRLLDGDNGNAYTLGHFTPEQIDGLADWLLRRGVCFEESGAQFDEDDLRDDRVTTSIVARGGRAYFEIYFDAG